MEKRMPDRREGWNVDTKLPITWLIGGAGAVLLSVITITWSVSAQNNKIENKLDRVLQQNTGIEKRLDNRDVQLDTLRSELTKLQQSVAIHDLKITALEARK